jgi:CubicO group peptidase (beta-lactamase class C family)
MQKILFFLTLTICFICAPASASNKEKADELIKQALSKGEFSGVVLVEKDGTIVYRTAVGLANRQFGIANDLNTRFRICSVTKQFTAVLVMQLVEAAKIDLDKTVADYLPDFRKETGGKIKVRDLLLSASGLPVLPDEFYVSEDAKMADAGFVIGKYLQGDLAFQPGERFNYNNGDFIILGAIVAKVSGKPYDAVLKEKILDPLGMKNTGLLKNEDVVPNLAGGYSFKNGGYLNESFVQIQNFGAAGAMYSTAGDLQLWNRALLANNILSKKFTDEMFTPSPKLGFVALGSWAYDLKLASGKTARAVERQGYINGFCALNIIIPDEKISAVFLSNTETQTLFQTYASRGLSYEVLNALF